MGIPIPYWLNYWGFWGIFIALIIATIIESSIINRLVRIAYRKTIYLVFLTNIMTGIMQWILSTCIGKIYSNYFLPLYLNISPEQIKKSSLLPMSIMATGILFFLTVFCIKMIIQYFIIRRYHANTNHATLKKSIVYATIASYAALCMLEILLYHIVEIKTITYPLL